MPEDNPFGCPECRITSWTGNPTLLFEDEFDVYAGSSAAFDTVWSPTPGTNPLTTAHAYSGSWGVGNPSSFDVFGRGIAPTSPNIIFSVQVYWTGQSPSGQGAILCTNTAVHDGFNMQWSIQFLSGGEVWLRRSSGHINVAVSAPALIENQWNCVTGVMKTTQDGAYRIYVNGVVVLEGTAVLIHNIGFPAIGGIGIGIGGNYWIDNLWSGTVESFTDSFFCTTPPTPPPHNPCACPPPPKQPPPISDPPPITPGIGEQLACLGGGLVPIQADFVPSELWWGL